MKKVILIYPFLLLAILIIFSNGCSKDKTPEPVYPKIRLETGSGLNPGADINFVALSKDVNYFDFTSEELFSYQKTSADWYIDGGVIPFVTNYKEFKLPTGQYYLLLSASGTVMTTTVTVLQKDQTFVISASMGSIHVSVE
jgi:hypothetical protein